MVSQSRHENFSRTVWTTFHWRGMTFSDHPLARHVRGNGLPEGRLRAKAVTLVVLATAFSAAGSSSVAVASSSSSCHDDPIANDQHDLHRARRRRRHGRRSRLDFGVITAGTNLVGSSAYADATGPITRRHENNRFALTS